MHTCPFFVGYRDHRLPFKTSRALNGDHPVLSEVERAAELFAHLLAQHGGELGPLLEDANFMVKSDIGSQQIHLRYPNNMTISAIFLSLIFVRREEFQFR